MSSASQTMKPKTLNCVAFASAVIGFLLYLFLIWLWYGQPQYGPPPGARTDLQPIRIGGAIFFAIFFPKIGLTLLATILAFAISLITTTVAWLSGGQIESRPAWIPFCISTSVCILIFLKHNSVVLNQSFFAGLLPIAFIGFGLSTVGAIGVALSPNRTRIERLFLLSALSGYALGIFTFSIIGIAAFLIGK
jgi:hypothetical protein